MMKVFYGTKRFLEDIVTPDDFLHKLDVAGEHMEADTPRLYEAIEDIVSSRVSYDPVAIRYALKGAATMRAM